MIAHSNDPAYDAIAAAIKITRAKLNPHETQVIWKGTTTMTNAEPTTPVNATPKEERPKVAKGAYKSKHAAASSIPDKDLPPNRRLHQTPNEAMKSRTKADGSPKVKAADALKTKSGAEAGKDESRAKRKAYEDLKASSPADIATKLGKEWTPKRVRTILRRIEDQLPKSIIVAGVRWGFKDLDKISELVRKASDDE